MNRFPGLVLATLGVAFVLAAVFATDTNQGRMAYGGAAFGCVVAAFAAGLRRGN